MKYDFDPEAPLQREVFQVVEQLKEQGFTNTDIGAAFMVTGAAVAADSADAKTMARVLKRTAQAVRSGSRNA